MGGSSGETSRPPQFVEDAQRDAINIGRGASMLGYVPYQGPTVAALSPMQLAAMNAASSDLRTFGYDAPMDARSGMPETMTMGGVTGYSPYPIYLEAVERLKETAPAQYDFIRSHYIDPVTGAKPTRGILNFDSQVQQALQTPSGGGGGGVDIVLPQGKPPDVLEWLKGKGFNLGFGNKNSKVDDLIKAGLVGNNTPDPEFDAKKGSWKKGGPC